MRSLLTLTACTAIVLLAGSESTSHAQTKSDIPLKKYRDLLTANGWFTNKDVNGLDAAKISFYLIFNKDGTFSYEEHDGVNAPLGGGGAWELDGDQLKLEFENPPASLNTKTQTSTIKFLPHEENMYIFLQENGKNYWHPELS
jgi:hypothetical protein